MFNRNLHYPLPTDIDNLLPDTDDEKIREYLVDYNNRSSNSRLVLSYHVCTLCVVTTTSSVDLGIDDDKKNKFRIKMNS